MTRVIEQRSSAIGTALLTVVDHTAVLHPR